jgi:hypothetical protein
MLLAERIPRQVDKPQVAELPEVHDVVELLKQIVSYRRNGTDRINRLGIGINTGYQLRQNGE